MKALQGLAKTLSALAVTTAAVGQGIPQTQIVELPPMLVEVTVKPKPWLYAELPGLVVLSRCDESTTLEFIRGNFRAEQVLRFAFPELVTATFSQPRLLILSTQAQTATAQQVLLKDVAPPQPTKAGPQSVQDQRLSVLGPGAPGTVVFNRSFGAGRGLAQAVRFLSNLRLEDTDLVATFAMVDEASFNGDNIKISEGYLHLLLTRRTPPLPKWLRVGLEQLYRSSALEVDRITVGPLLWVSETERKLLLSDRYFPRTLFPLAEVLESDGPVDEDNSEDAVRWRAEAGLFVRWALHGGDAGAVASFWKFAERAIDGGANEALVKEFFRMTYADLRDALSDSLADAKFSDGGWKITGRVEKAPSIRLREATPEQIARVRGEWERLEIGYVAENHPEYVDAYVERATADLSSAYTAGQRDPDFLGTWGLFLREVRKDSSAAGVLEESARSPGARQKVLRAAAQARYDAALATVQDGRFSSAQVANILELTARARKLQPADAELYTLIAATLSRGTEPPSAENLAALDEGVRLFPGNRILALLRSRLAPGR